MVVGCVGGGSGGGGGGGGGAVGRVFVVGCAAGAHVPAFTGA